MTLVNAWLAHKDAISHMQYVQWTEGVTTPMDLLITSSADGRVLLWTLEGVHIGMFGQEHPWTLVNNITWAGKKRDIVARAKKIGQVMQNFNLFTSKMKRHTDKSELHEAEQERRRRDGASNDEDSYRILQARTRNKFKLSFLDDIQQTDHSVPEPEISAQQMLLQTMSKLKRKPKPSEMPTRPTARQTLRDQQIMHRMSLPKLQHVPAPQKLARSTSVIM